MALRPGRSLSPRTVALLLTGLCAVLGAMLALTLAQVRLPHRRLATLALLAPLLACRMGAVWRRVDPVALRAAQTLGIGRWRSLSRLVLPEIAAALATELLLAAIVAEAALLLFGLAPGRAYTASP